MDGRLRLLNADLYKFRHILTPMISGCQKRRKGTARTSASLVNLKLHHYQYLRYAV